MTNELVLYGTVGAGFWDEEFFTAKQVREQLSQMSGDIVVRLNSGGGIATEGQAIYTGLVDYPGRVEIVVDGIAASAASLIAMAGDEITMRAGSIMMIHDPASMWVEGRGTAEEHERAAEGLNALGDAYASIYAKRAGIDKEAARKIMREEVYLNAEAAVAAGFATYTDEKEASEPVAFDYRVYGNAPANLKAKTNISGKTPDVMAAVAMIAGLPSLQPKGPKKMADDTKMTQGTPKTAPGSQPDMNAVAKKERERIFGIQKVAKSLSLGDDVATMHIESGISLDQARAAMLDAFADAPEADHHEPKHSPAATIKVDERDKFKEGAAKALAMKAGFKDGERNEFTSMSLSEIARMSIDRAGERGGFDSRMEMVGRAFTMSGAGHSTSDFSQILENVANKSMLRGYDEQEETFELWTSTGTLTDFKTAKRLGLASFPNLAKVSEGAEFTYATLGEYGEPVVLGTYGKMFSITRQAIINDDLSAFTTIPMKMGRASRRTVGDLAYGVLTANAAMSDGTALFHADHGNLAGTGGAPSVATFNAAVTAMGTNNGRAGAGVTALNIRPAFGIFPFALRGSALQTLNSEHDPSKSSRTANTVKDLVAPIFDARLDADSATAWYMAGNPAMADTIEISYLDGQNAPFMDRQDGWKVDGVEFKVRMDVAASALGYEGLYKNAGA